MTNRTAATRAFLCTYLDEENQDIDEEICRMLAGDQSYEESLQFSELHRIVLGLSTRSLEAELQTSGVNIDELDLLGRSALM